MFCKKKCIVSCLLFFLYVYICGINSYAVDSGLYGNASSSVVYTDPISGVTFTVPEDMIVASYLRNRYPHILEEAGIDIEEYNERNKEQGIFFDGIDRDTECEILVASEDLGAHLRIPNISNADIQAYCDSVNQNPEVLELQEHKLVKIGDYTYIRCLLKASNGKEVITYMTTSDTFGICFTLTSISGDEVSEEAEQCLRSILSTIENINVPEKTDWLDTAEASATESENTSSTPSYDYGSFEFQVANAKTQHPLAYWAGSLTGIAITALFFGFIIWEIYKKISSKKRNSINANNYGFIPVEKETIGTSSAVSCSNEEIITPPVPLVHQGNLNNDNVNRTGSSLDDTTMNEIYKWKSLLDEGIITQEEFDRKKTEILKL